MCMCNFDCKGCPRNDLYCVGRDVKPYSLTHSKKITAPVRQMNCTATFTTEFHSVSVVLCANQSLFDPVMTADQKPLKDPIYRRPALHTITAWTCQASRSIRPTIIDTYSTAHAQISLTSYQHLRVIPRLNDRANVEQAWWNPVPGSNVGLGLAHS